VKDDQMSNSGPYSGNTRPWRAAAVAAALVATPLLAAACDGAGSHASGSGSSSGQNLTVAMDSYASCMRSHGVAGFYFTRGTSSPPPMPEVELFFRGYSADIDPSSTVVQAAQKTCKHLLGLPSSPPHESHQQFLRAVKSAECMRSHGYPNWPDPNPTVPVHFIPAGVNTNSPQFQAAAKSCGEPDSPPGG
jgi:hypothetical protein